jgi:hypothetical protein
LPSNLLIMVPSSLFIGFQPELCAAMRSRLREQAKWTIWGPPKH